jgi:hypothetical protein
MSKNEGGGRYDEILEFKEEQIKKLWERKMMKNEKERKKERKKEKYEYKEKEKKYEYV